VKVVLRPDWLGGRLHVVRIRRSEREQVRHTKCAVPPGLGESDAAADGWIVGNLVGSARIETDKDRVAFSGQVAEVAL